MTETLAFWREQQEPTRIAAKSPFKPICLKKKKNILKYGVQTTGTAEHFMT